MGQTLQFPPARDEVRARYRVRLLEDAQLTDRGVAGRLDGERREFEWSCVLRALAAEVGEPQGVRTIVFDFVVEQDASGCDVIRMDAEPGDPAIEVARAVASAVGPDCHVASIKSLATDGLPSQWYPDVPSLDEGALLQIDG